MLTEHTITKLSSMRLEGMMETYKKKLKLLETKYKEAERVVSR